MFFFFNLNAYIWNLEKCYRWSSVQSRNRDTDIENKYMDTKGQIGWVGRTRRLDWYIYTTDAMEKGNFAINWEL